MNQKATHSTSILSLAGSKLPWLVAVLCLLPCMGATPPPTIPINGAGLFEPSASVPGALYANVNSLSSDGTTFVGADTIGRTTHAYLWKFDGTQIDLGTLGGNYSNARAVSADCRVVVGDANDASSNGHAFRWTAGVMTDLGTFGALILLPMR